MYRVVKVDAHDWTSLHGVMTDGTVEANDKDLTFSHPSSGGHYTKKNRPIWRLTPSTDDHHSSAHPNHPIYQPQSSTNGIKPTEMMHVAINYGGLPGLAYVKSIDEFVSGIEDPLLQEVVARKCDLLTDRAYSIGLLFKEQQRQRSLLASQHEIEQCLAVIDEQNEAAMIKNNDMIIKVLSSCDLQEDIVECLFKKLRQQLAILTLSLSSSSSSSSS